MNFVKCQNGHFYDQSRTEECPHCEPDLDQGDNMTVPLMYSNEDVVTAPLTGPVFSQSDVTEAQGMPSLGDAVKSAIGGSDEKTVGYYERSMGTEPVVGWLICLTGGHFGEDFRLKSGRNFIGRSTEMDVVIAKDSAVSREKHAIVVYEPKGRKFLAMPGEAKELCYLNGDVVLTPVEINSGDKLSLGETELMFIPCCGEEFSWDDVKKEEK